MMHRLSPVLLLVLLPALCGCASLRALNPLDKVSASDMEWKGVKDGEVLPATPFIAAAAYPEIGKFLADNPQIKAAMAASASNDPLGVMMPVTPVGVAVPRWIFCQTALVRKCSGIKLKAGVSFAGVPVTGPGVDYWMPSRLTAEGWDD